MPNQPTLIDVMSAIQGLHGDVKDLHGDVSVALDRTVSLERTTTVLSSKVDNHGLQIAGAKAQATMLASIGSAVVVGVIELGKRLLGDHNG